MSFLRALLAPFALLYGIGVRFRNFLYDTGIFASKEFGVPLISVGNLSTGGTGKTPHVEHVLELLLKKGYRPAVLSRGYKRKSSGFQEAENPPDARKVGDEAAQIKTRHPEVPVAVSNDRGKGIHRLRDRHHSVDVILLDDAFQHRSVNAGMNLLLTSYDRLYFEDHLLPRGRLREPVSGAKRADIIIVTKCPHDMKPLDQRIVHYKMEPLDHQEVYFSSIEHGTPRSVFGEGSSIELSKDRHYIVLTGIEDPEPLYEHLREQECSFEAITRSDHHRFTAGDLRHLEKRLEHTPVQNPIVLTSEKDAARIRSSELADRFAQLPLYAIPIKVRIHGEEEAEQFLARLTKHVREDQRNDRVHPEQE